MVLVLLATSGYGLDESPASSAPQPILLRLDPNEATLAELDLLPGIGPRRAAAIITFRETAARAPAFRQAVDLDRVPGIGPVTIARVQSHLCFPADRNQAP